MSDDVDLIEVFHRCTLGGACNASSSGTAHELREGLPGAPGRRQAEQRRRVWIEEMTEMVSAQVREYSRAGVLSAEGVFHGEVAAEALAKPVSAKWRPKP